MGWDAPPSTQQMLDEARAAYHELATGKAVVSFRDSNGESVTYTPANLVKLSEYIQSLEDKVSCRMRSNPPMKFFF